MYIYVKNITRLVTPPNFGVNKYGYLPASTVINLTIFRMETDINFCAHCKLSIN